MRAHTIAPAFIVLNLAIVSLSQAAVLTVTSSADDGSPGCLRWCIEHAQPGDHIQFDPSLDGRRIVLHDGALVFDKNLRITGRGPMNTIIDGNYSSRVIYVASGNLRLSGVTIRNGFSASWAGAGVVCQNGNLTIEHSVIRGNITTGFGGGVYNGLCRSVTVRHSTISDNSATAGGGGLFVSNPYIGRSMRVAIESSTITGNLTLNDGGGIYSWGARLAVRQTTISNNTAYRGGGVFAAMLPPLVQGYPIDSSTITNNSAVYRGAGVYLVASRIHFSNSIVADQARGRDCAGYYSSDSFGHNLDSDRSCDFDQPTDQPNTDPLLGPLQDNGGPTWTHAPLAGSPVIDRGWCDPGTDQRGVPRPLDGNRDGVWICDIGAVEYNPFAVEVVGPGGEVIVPTPDGE
jgi:hypothetical protein